MLPSHGLTKSCSLLAVVCGRGAGKPRGDGKGRKVYPFPEMASSGRLEVHTLANPSTDKFREVQRAVNPSVLYLQGEVMEGGEEVGSILWGGMDLLEPESLCTLIGLPLPTIVYLDAPNGEKAAEALCAKGVPYVIYWKQRFSIYSGSQFRQALLSVIQSSCSHIWDAFQLAQASFMLYVQCNNVSSSGHKLSSKQGPYLLGEAPKIVVPLLDRNPEDEEEGSSEALPAIKIYDDEVDMRFLVCGLPDKLDSSLLNALEEGLNALLKIEIRGSKLHNRVSAAPPPLQAGSLTRGVVTMRCDMTTCSSAHVSLLVSGSAQTCFDDQLLETHIKHELVENSRLIQAVLNGDDIILCPPEPRKSSSVACGASTLEVHMKVPLWASQVLRQLAPEVCYRSFLALGIAGIQGSPVASFEKEDAERLLFFSSRKDDQMAHDYIPWCNPSWFSSPVPSRKRPTPDLEMNSITKDTKALNGVGGRNMQVPHARQRLRVAAMRPVPHTRQHKMLPFSGMSQVDFFDGNQTKPSLAVAPSVKHMPAPPVTHRKTSSNSFHAQQIISLNPLPLKKHNCGRAPIPVCSEEEFLRDVMQFLILRGHSRLVPSGGLSEFPDAILNAKRLDLYNLYREVVSRGGFHVGNGINWKGQVFSKMKNHTLTNRMTGVGNTLKRHYETYLLEYELAHDDVDGECCLLCHSSAPGDWVNCGLCGEWAHFGCDRRQGLGAFKDYAKTDGLDYVCPQCSISSVRRKSQKIVNGVS